MKIIIGAVLIFTSIVVGGATLAPGDWLDNVIDLAVTLALASLALAGIFYGLHLIGVFL